MALVQVAGDGLRERPGRFRIRDSLGGDRLLGDQQRDAGALGIVVLARNVEDVCADQGGDILENAGQALGVVFLVDVFDVFTAMLLALGVTDVVDVEAQRLREVVETVKPDIALERL